MFRSARPQHWKRSAAAMASVIGAAAAFALAGTVPAEADQRSPGPGFDILFVRHAHSNSGPGAVNPPLSDEGMAQAEALAAELDAEPVDAVHTSMLLRAFQTGAAVAADHQLPMSTDARINEVSFDLSDLPTDDRGALAARLGDILDQWSRGLNRDVGFGGESFNDVEARWRSWWNDFTDEHRVDKGSTVVVAHSALLGLMLPETCSNPVDLEFQRTHPITNTMVIRARLHPNGTLSCLMWGDTPVPSAAGTTEVGRR